MVGQLWATSSLGGFLYSDELSSDLRSAVQPLTKFRQLCDARDASEKGPNRGDAWHWDVVSDLAGTGGTLVETNTMPETQATFRQGTLTVNEYGQGVPFTAKLDNLSKWRVKPIVSGALKNDCKKTLDRAAHDQFNLTPLRVIASAGTDTASVTLYSNGTVTGTNSVNLNTGHVKAIVDLMKERNIPPFINDDYLAVAHPTTWRPLKNGLESIHQYVDQGFQMILNGEIGRYEGVRFIEQNNVLKGVALGGTAWTNGKSNWAYFMGKSLPHASATVH
jgi:N4-gp56 family major capsid protein